jgi:hypothetical protein
MEHLWMILSHHVQYNGTTINLFVSRDQSSSVDTNDLSWTCCRPQHGSNRRLDDDQVSTPTIIVQVPSYTLEQTVMTVINNQSFMRLWGHHSLLSTSWQIHLHSNCHGPSTPHAITQVCGETSALSFSQPHGDSKTPNVTLFNELLCELYFICIWSRFFALLTCYTLFAGNDLSITRRVLWNNSWNSDSYLNKEFARCVWGLDGKIQMSFSYNGDS